MSILGLISLLVGLYIIGESVVAACAMDRGDKLCRMAKYLLSGIAGMVLILYPPNLTHLVFGLAIAAFTWPKVAERFRNFRHGPGAF